MVNCAFCELPEIKERTILENDLMWVIPTNIPIVPGHVLVLPKRCIATLEELTPEEMGALSELIIKLKIALTKEFKAEGFNFAINEGVVAGQTVPHFHMHMLPRKEGDTGITEYEPRKFLYRPGSRETTPEAELKAISESIKKHL